MRLSERVKRLEARHTPPGQTAMMAADAERFRIKFLDLVERQQGQPAGPGDAPVIHDAALFWHDPEAAIARMKERATEIQARWKEQGRWHER